MDPDGWAAWVGMLGRMEFPVLGGGLWFLPVPLLVRLPVAAALIAWGARTDRAWVLPVGVCLSHPTVWLNTPTILVALIPLVALGARTPAGAWLRSPAQTTARTGARVAWTRRRLRTWLARAS
jgi:hypothetical protein